MEFIESIKQVDTSLFLFINRHHLPFFDTVFYWATGRLAWIPLYAFLLFLSIKKYKSKTWFFLLAIAVLILCSDQFSVLVKNTVQRYRPCHNANLSSLIRLINDHCGGIYGFVSSHATNSMALMFFLNLTLLHRNRPMKFVMAVYVILVSYSRIYVGVHYPLDILAGWLLGILIAMLISVLLARVYPALIREY
jgi:undecaprenyl-diphosphatase